MSNDPLLAIHSELAAIATILTVISYLVGAALIVVIIRGSCSSIRECRRMMDDQFRRKAEVLFNENKLAELRALVQARLKEEPNHANARWFLARTLYLTEDYDNAVREFKYLERIYPSWKEKSIDPYLQEIERLRQYTKSDR